MATTDNTIAKVNNCGFASDIKEQLENIIGHKALTASFISMDNKTLNFNINILIDGKQQDVDATKEEITKRVNAADIQYKITQTDQIPEHYKIDNIDKPTIISFQFNGLENSQNTVDKLKTEATKLALAKLGLEQKPTGFAVGGSKDKK